MLESWPQEQANGDITVREIVLRVAQPPDDVAVREMFVAMWQELLNDGDSPDLHQLADEYVDGVLNGDFAHPFHYYSQPRRRLWVAEPNDGAVAGMTAVDSTEDPGVAELFRMYVRPGQRGKGLSKLLLATAEEWAACQGYTKLRLRTTERNVAAIALYRAMGFAETHVEDLGLIKSLHFEKRLTR